MKLYVELALALLLTFTPMIAVVTISLLNERHHSKMKPLTPKDSRDA